MREAQGEAAGTAAFGILPENWDAARVFFSCATQWHRRRAETLEGLRYEAVRVVIDNGAFAAPRDVFDRVQVMERAAVEQARRMAPKS